MRLRTLLKMLDEAMLLEGTKYDPMFSEIIKLVPNRANSIQAMINWARQTLRREDRIVWFLRWFRLFDIGELVSSVANPTDENWAKLEATFKQLQLKYNAQMAKSMAGRSSFSQGLPYTSIRRLQGDLSHFLSLPVPAIQNHVFTNESPVELGRLFMQMEEQWKKEQAEKAQHLQSQDGDQILINFGDGWAWWLLNRGSCDAEARAMGHCGNVPSERRGDRILSLRKQGSAGWRPSLTFILHEDGKLGEMKGRGNDKPAKQYHPYIIKLLEHPLIQGIRGGGYMPEHNFSLRDLPKEEQERLAELKPGLASGSYLLKKHGPTDEFAQKILAEMNSTTDGNISLPRWDSENKIFIVEEFESPHKFVDYYGTDFLKRVSQMFDGGDSFWDDMSGAGSDGKEIYKNLPPDILLKIATYAQNNYGDSPEYEDVDWGDSDEVWDVLTGADDDIINALRWGEETGYRYGAEAACWRDFENVIRDPWSNMKRGEEAPDYLTMKFTMYTDEKGEESIVWDSPCWITLTPENAARIVDEDGLLEGIADQGWTLGGEVDIQEPHYGWSDYDADAAREDALERLYDYLT